MSQSDWTMVVIVVLVSLAAIAKYIVDMRWIRRRRRELDDLAGRHRR